MFTLSLVNNPSCGFSILAKYITVYLFNDSLETDFNAPLEHVERFPKKIKQRFLESRYDLKDKKITCLFREWNCSMSPQLYQAKILSDCMHTLVSKPL